tara:strand:- start:20337 stop:20849 length:513 start_codon:yes stop_codon:yes gene_type:complete
MLNGKKVPGGFGGGNVGGKGGKGATIDLDKLKMGVNPFVYKTPVNESSSILFALRGVKATSVDLVVGNTLLSSVVPVYSADWTPQHVTNLQFFGDEPFHAALTTAQKFVIVKTEDGEFPEVMFGLVKDTLTWDIVKNDHHIVDVEIGTANGKKKARLVYTHAGCGFLKDE